MNLDNEHDALFEQLLTINQTTFEGQWYKTAYHALAAAFHRAQDLGAVSLMAQVQQLATQQMNTIDISAPEHALSSQSAHTRGAIRVFIASLLNRQQHGYVSPMPGKGPEDNDVGTQNITNCFTAHFR